MKTRWTKPLPPDAKMVFKGVLFEVWQWEQKMYDGTVRTFERLKRPNTVEVIAVVGDKILIQNQEQPDSGEFISMPGGRCDPGEEPETSAMRELLEETGYISDDWELLSEEMPSGKMEWTLYNFVARNCIKKQEPEPESGEKINSRLVTFDELLQLSDDPNFRSTGIRTLLWRARLNENKKQELHALLFKE